MSSRDRSGQSGPPRRPAGPTERTQPKRDSQWDIDPAEIDRYLSGRPQRSANAPQSSQRSRSKPQFDTSGDSTADQLAQLRQMVAQDSNPPARQNQPSRGNQQDRSSRPVAPRSRPVQADQPAFQPPSVNRAPQSNQAARPRPSRQDSRDTDREQLLRADPYVDTPEYVSADQYDAYYDETDTFDDELIDERMASRGLSRTPSLPSMPKISMPTMPKLVMPQSVAQAALFSDIVSLSLIGVGVISIAAMAILVGNRIDTLPALIPTHVSASGLLEHMKSRSALWNLPLLSAMLTLMNIVIALFVARIDRFASRFILGAALVVQFVAWVAVFRIL